MRSILILAATLCYCSVGLANNEKAKVTWTAVFDNIVPRSESVSMEYCKQHTPTVMVTTIDEITSDHGVKTLNNLWVKYLSYRAEKKDGLLFNTVDAVVRGEDAHGPWQESMKLYEQTLSEEDQGVTWTVWSTNKCKGTFLCIPTVEKYD